MRRKIVINEQGWDDRTYDVVEDNTLQQLDKFFTDVFPLLTRELRTLGQLQVCGVILSRQLSGKPCSISGLSRKFGIARTTVQHTVDTLIDKGWLKMEFDPNDERSRPLRIPRTRAKDCGDIVAVLVDFRIKSFNSLSRSLSSRSDENQV